MGQTAEQPAADLGRQGRRRTSSGRCRCSPADKVRRDQNQSSPIVCGERVFVTVSYWPGGVEPQKEYPEHHVLCFDAKDGKRLWDTMVRRARGS